MRPELIHPLVLAYLGDGVFEVYVREYLVKECQLAKPDLLQKKATLYVSARAQAGFMKYAIENELLSEEDTAWLNVEYGDWMVPSLSSLPLLST